MPVRGVKDSVNRNCSMGMLYICVEKKERLKLNFKQEKESNWTQNRE